MLTLIVHIVARMAPLRHKSALDISNLSKLSLCLVVGDSYRKWHFLQLSYTLQLLQG